MRTILFTNARDEKHIIEWVAHHLNLGFTTIYITDHASDTPIDTLFKENPRIIINRAENISKGDLISKALLYAKENTYTWMLYLDADEFIYLRNTDTITSFLKEYDSYDQVGLNWLLFGNNFLERDIPNKTMLEMYTKCEATFNKHIKAFIRPEKATRFYNPHAYNGTSKDKMVSASKKLLTHPKPWFFLETLSYKDVPAYIAHYIYQSYHTYISRKVNRPRDDNLKYRDEKLTLDQVNSMYNDHQNTHLLDKYNTKNLITIKEITRDN